MSYIRRSGRLNRVENQPSNVLEVNSSQEKLDGPDTKPEVSEGCENQPEPDLSPKWIKTPEIQEQEPCDIEMKQEVITPQKVVEEKYKPESPTPSTEVPDKKTSATTKALLQLAAQKKKAKKNSKPSGISKRKMWNERLSRILVPKSALNLLHEIKPECTYKFKESQGTNQPLFEVQVELKGLIIGTGQGTSKSMAKNIAAENAIKFLISSSFQKIQNVAKEEDENEKQDENKHHILDENCGVTLPWAGLASFAIHKLFSDWQIPGVEFGPFRPSPKPKVLNVNKISFQRKELPPGASEMHPASMLNLMIPGITAVEIEREDKPQGKVKMGYSVDGKMFVGVGGNKKEAKKEAAKAVLTGIYGLTYP